MNNFDFRKERKNLKLSQSQLGKLLHIPKDTVARWERGDMHIRHIEILRLAMEHLNCVISSACKDCGEIGPCVPSCQQLTDNG